MQTADDSCGEGCAQLDDFNWFLPADERAGDLPRRLRRRRDVLMEDGAVAVDTSQVSAASDTVVSREIHRKSECIPTVVPRLAAAHQAASEVVQPRPRDSGCMDLLPPVGECPESLGMDTPDDVKISIRTIPAVMTYNVPFLRHMTSNKTYDVCIFYKFVNFVPIGWNIGTTFIGPITLQQLH